jgi:hypothetical protein
LTQSAITCVKQQKLKIFRKCQRSSSVAVQYIGDEQHITNIFYPAEKGTVETVPLLRPAGIDCPSLPYSFLRRP